MELGAVVIALVAGAVALGWHLLFTSDLLFGKSRSQNEPWRSAAEAAGLTEITAGNSLDRWLNAKAGDLTVRLETYRHGSKSGTRILINGLRHWPDEFALRAEDPFKAVESLLGSKELIIGDPGFDDVAFVQGTPELVYALLDFETRAQLAGLLQGRNGQAQATLSDQELRIEVPDDAQLDILHDRVGELLPIAVTLASRLVRPDDLPARLAHNAQKDPAPGVRLANLQVLLLKHKKTAVGEQTLRAALDDPDEEVRVTAAAALGGDGRPTLLKVALETTDDARAARAVGLLGESLPWDKAQELLERSLSGGRARTALHCIEALGRMGRREALDLLRRAVETEPEELAVAAARALGTLGYPACEAPLVAALARDVPRVVVAAAEGLGKLGSVSAVAALQEASDRRWLDGDVRRATRQAVAEIQSRQTGASPGQLSLTAGDSGQVSLAEDATKSGQLSLDEGDRKP